MPDAEGDTDDVPDAEGVPDCDDDCDGVLLGVGEQTSFRPLSCTPPNVASAEKVTPPSLESRDAFAAPRPGSGIESIPPSASCQSIGTEDENERMKNCDASVDSVKDAGR